MRGIGKKCNELLTDIFNQGKMNWIWPHFPSVTMTYIRADKADEVPLSNRNLTLNYVYQWEKLLLNSSELIQTLFLFFLHTKGKWFSRAKVKKKKRSSQTEAGNWHHRLIWKAQSRKRKSNGHETFTPWWFILHLVCFLPSKANPINLGFF